VRLPISFLKPTLTHARLREVLDYNPETGTFTWRVSSGGTLKGTKAGFQLIVGNHRYWRTAIDGRYYLAHRLAYFWMTGDWPPHLMDHKDGNGLNNRWRNLRLATSTQNSANQRTRRNNQYGLKGVCTYHHNPKRVIAVCAGKHLGIFDTPEEAHAVYLREAKRRWGEYARAA
jgi:hypothetical protein